MTRFATACFALIASAGTAAAGGLDAPVARPAVAPVAAAPEFGPLILDWSGFYVGLQAARGEIEVADAVDRSEDVQSFGGHLGYLYDTGRVVIGAELDFGTLDPVDGDAGDDSTLFRAKGLAGIEVGRMLPYLMAGFARIDTDDTDGSRENIDGYLYGVGIAYMLNDRFRIGGEVLQHRFDDVFDTQENLDATSISLKASFAF